MVPGSRSRCRRAQDRAGAFRLSASSRLFIAPYLAKDAAFIDFSGGYSLTDTGANGAQVEALIQKHAPHLRMLTRGKRLYADGERRAPSLSQVNAAFARFSLRVDTADCARITVHGLPPDLEPVFATSAKFEPRSKDTTYMVTCRVVPDSADRSAEIAGQKEADLVLDRLEDACPQLFQPRRVPTEYTRPHIKASVHEHRCSRLGKLGLGQVPGAAARG